MTSKNRRSPLSFSAGLLTLTFLTLGAVGGDTPRPWPGEELSGGETTVFDGKHSAYGRALGNLDRSRWLPMRAGKRLFENPWHPPGSVPATAPRQGLGPLFNATACVDCHFRDGRGGPPESPAPGIAPAPAPTLLRWGLPSGDG
ncbi:MAG: thiol oxidoreductase, partial [Acidobacteria bacterium]|nr:thiol oxidoreductase [Acidobacteriota bacterium]